jgi:hypothetical protein
VADSDRLQRDTITAGGHSPVQYAASGHPSIEQLMAQQGTGPISDVTILHGDFWPEDESIEEFLTALHEWRGHQRTDPAA